MILNIERAKKLKEGTRIKLVYREGGQRPFDLTFGKEYTTFVSKERVISIRDDVGDMRYLLTLMLKGYTFKLLNFNLENK